MAKAIKLQDLKKVLTLATSSTKKLVEAGVNGDKKNFPTLLKKYKWSGTRDFNLALIIIALYTYCLKQGGKLKNMAQHAIKKSQVDNEDIISSAFNALKYGKGTILVKYLKKDFNNIIQNLVFGMSEDKINMEIPGMPIIIQDGKDLTEEPSNEMLNKTFENGLFKQAAKIKPWKHNARDVAYCVELLKGKITKENEADLEKKLDEANSINRANFFENEKLKSQLKELDETGDKLLHERAATRKKLQKSQNAYNELLTNLKKLNEGQKGSNHTDITEFANITELEAQEAQEAQRITPENVIVDTFKKFFASNKNQLTNFTTAPNQLTTNKNIQLTFTSFLDFLSQVNKELQIFGKIPYSFQIPNSNSFKQALEDGTFKRIFNTFKSINQNKLSPENKKVFNNVLPLFEKFANINTSTNNATNLLTDAPKKTKLSVKERAKLLENELKKQNESKKTYQKESG